MDKIAEKSKDFPTLVRKFIGHYGLFAANGVFAVLSAVSFIKKVNLSIIISVLLGVTISATSEIIQGFTEGRTLALTDVILNVQGHISGISLALLFVLLFKVKRSENIKQNITSFITFLGLAISSILLYFIFSEKYESVEVCTTVESFVLAIWFIIEGVYILIKYNKLKNKN